MAYKLAVVAFVVLLMVLSTSATLCDTTMPDNVFQLDVDAAVDSYAETYDVEGNSSEITLSQDDNEYLHLNTESRDIFVKKELYGGLVISLVLYCTPNGGTQESHILTFMIITPPSSNEPPEFSKTTYSFNVREDAKVLSTVDHSIVATDNEGDAIYYRIVDAKNSDFFELKSTRDPTIILAKPIDYESVQTVSFFILAENDQASGGLGMSAKVDIHIINVDDMSPVFQYTNYSGSLTDDFEVGSAIEIHPPLLAIDQDDMNTSIKYSIIAGEGFVMDENTGEITVDAVPKIGYFHLVVQAWQENDPSKADWTLVKIYVAATNNTELKFEQNIYIATLSETTPVGVPFLTVRGKYSGSSSLLQYGISGPSAQFEMERDSLLLKSSLDYETGTGHDLNITVTDGVATATAQVSIIVKDANDNTPDILNGRNVNVQINAMTNRENIHTIEAFDADVNNLVTFHLESGPASFVIGLNSGIINYTAAENSETHDEVYLLVKVKDDGDPYRETSVGVTVQFLRHPVFEHSTYEVKISEAEPVDALVLTVSAMDDPFGDSLEYGIYEDMTHFGIHKESGEIFLRQSLDYETSHHHIIHVTATDNVTTATAQVSITVEDANDNTPEILNERNVYVQINMMTDRENVHTVEASDADVNNLVTFHLESGPASFVIGLNSGIIRYTAAENSATDDEVYLLVKVKDDGDPYRETSVGVTVQFLRHPVFGHSTYEVKISEAEPVDALVLTVSAMDDPFGDSLEYGFFEDMTHFGINKESGEMFLRQSLDYEASHHHIFHVTATDNVSTATATVEVIVINVNDNNPKIVRIDEATNLELIQGAHVFTIQAEDVDPETTLTYHMVSGEPYFSVDAIGSVKIAAADEMSTKKEYTVHVMVRDSGTPHRETAVVHTVTFPKRLEFSPTDYSVTVSESQAVGSTLIVLATDDDSIENIEFGFVEAVSLFQIDSTSGSLKLHEMLDYENLTSHILHVRAVHGMQTANATVTIEVTDVNDNNPAITNEMNVVITVNGEKDEIVHQIQAADEDSNTELSYHMSVGAPLFAVSSTGVVTIAVDTEELTEDKYFILVKVRDNGRAYRESTVSITVDLTGGGVVPPQAVTQAGGSDLLVVIILGVAAGIFLLALFASVVYGKKKRIILKSQLDQVVYAKQKNREISEPIERFKKSGHYNFGYKSHNGEDYPPSPETVLDTTETVDLDNVSDGGTTVQENPLAMNGNAHQFESEVDDVTYSNVHKVGANDAVYEHKSEKMPVVEEIQVQSIFLPVDEGDVLHTYEKSNADVDDSDSSTGSTKDLFPVPPKKILRFRTPSMEDMPDLQNIQVKL